MRNCNNKAIYIALEQDLRNDILNGILQDNAKIPSESELCCRYGTSRGTVRKALTILANQNFIRKINGLGSFVVPAKEREQNRQKRGIFRVITPKESMDLFDCSAFAGVDYFAKNNDFVTEHRFDEQSAEQILADYYNFLIDGVIWVRASKNAIKKIEFLRDKNFPQVVIERNIEGVNKVLFSNASVFEDAVYLLHALGHRAIAMVDLEHKNSEILNKRIENFSQACKKFDCKEDILLVKNQHELSPIFQETCAYIIVQDALPYIKDILLKITKEQKNISLILFSQNRSDDDISVARIYHPVFELGEKSAEILAKNNSNSNKDVHHLDVKGKLLVGRSLNMDYNQLSYVLQNLIK